MRAAVVLTLLIACSPQPAPKTPESMLAYRLSHAMCERTCPVGEYITPKPAHNLEDCCVDPFGYGWSSGAWNSSGRFATREQLLDPSRLGGDCGGEGYPDCKP